MSTEHDIKYTWVEGGNSLSVTRQMIASASPNLEWAIPTGSVNLKTSSSSFQSSKVQSIFMYSDQTITLAAGGANDLQTLTITGGTATGGTFTLTFGAQTTSAIPYNATASQVQTALQALSSIGAGNMLCTGGPLPSVGIACEFSGSLALASQSVMTHTDSLTGSGSPVISIAHTATGSAATFSAVLIAGVPLIWDVAGIYTYPFPATVNSLWASNSSGAQANFHARILSNS